MPDLTPAEEFPNALNLWRYRSDKGGSVVAISPNGERHTFDTWQDFCWHAAHGQKNRQAKQKSSSGPC